MANKLTTIEHKPDMIQVAKALANETYRFLGVRPEELTAIYIKGYELGFKMTSSPEFIQSILGKPTLSPKGHLALLHASGLFSGNGYLKVEDLKNKDGSVLGCKVAMKRNDSNVEYETTFTMEDAHRAGLVIKASGKESEGWKSYPSNMCRWRAIGYCADIVAPDIGGGMLRANELGVDITPDGDIIEGNFSEAPSDLKSLSDTHGEEAVLDAMQNTDGSIQQMKDYLEKETKNDN